MSYRTVEVELVDGLVKPRGDEALPGRATALLTILRQEEEHPNRSPEPPAAGLHRFLSSPCTRLTEEQFRASLEADVFDQ